MGIRTAFFGTPDFAVPTLEALVATGRAPQLVVTQQARRAGRGARLRQPPVADSAAAFGLPLAQPPTLRSRTFRSEVAALDLDAIVVVAYGKIFGRRLLETPRWGCLNVHASLLPKHRGAAPIQASILSGDEITGVTIMRMGEGLDDGPVLMQRQIEIGATETTADLAPRLARLGAECMMETLLALEEGRSSSRSQDESLATYASKIAKSDGDVDWSRPAEETFRRWRAYTPWPGSTANVKGKPLKLLELELVSKSSSESVSAKPGEILGVDRDRRLLAVACGVRGDTILGLRVVQRPGRRPVRAVDLYHSEQLVPGELFAND